MTERSRGRPLFVTLACVLGFLRVLLLVIFAILPEYRLAIVQVLGGNYFITTSLFAAIGFIGLVGIWWMQRWGVVVYAAAAVSGIVYSMISGQYDLGPAVLVPPIVIIIIGTWYFKQMK